MRRYLLAAGLLVLSGPSIDRLTARPPDRPPDRLRFSVSFPAARSKEALDGRLLILISTDSTAEPRFQVIDNVATAQVYGVDVEGWRAGGQWAVGGGQAYQGYPLRTLVGLP